jgi:hypothetical protein
MPQIDWQKSARNRTRPCHSDWGTPAQQSASASDPNDTGHLGYRGKATNPETYALR